MKEKITINESLSKHLSQKQLWTFDTTDTAFKRFRLFSIFNRRETLLKLIITENIQRGNFLYRTHGDIDI